MQNITSVHPLDNFLLSAVFDTGERKIFDVKPYLDYPAFAPIRDKSVFQYVVARGYYIEWPGQDVDFGADTIWLEGQPANA